MRNITISGFFLESWMSVKDPNAGNYHMVIPKVYKVPRYLNSLNSTGNVSILKSRVTSNVFSTDEGLRISRKVLQKYKSL